MNTPTRWGIIGTGSIAAKFASELPHSATGTLAAVGSRSLESAKDFAARFGGARAHGSYEALLADAEVDAVYIATPHPMHASQAIAAAEAGKHILCEKPVALNHADAMVMIEAARRNRVFFMEAFMYRCHPGTQQIVEIVRSGRLGEVRIISATFSFAANYNPASRLFSNALGGGGILDVGCYTTSISRLVAGAALGLPVAEPHSVCGSAVLAETGVDTIACATLHFAGDILAQLSCGVAINQPNGLLVIGTEGRLRVANYWHPPCALEISDSSGSLVERLDTDPSPYRYALEADALAAALPELESPFVPWADTLGNMLTLDRWRRAVEVRYESEEAKAPERSLPLSGRPLIRDRFAEIPKVSVHGLEKPVSRLVLGIDNQSNFPHLAAMADDFIERGGNTFDTAFIYGNGRQERLLGRWLETRRIRDDVVVIAKGAHTPFCDPENLLSQLETSLDRLAISRADIYFMHRDNTAIPVGEFVDVLDDIRDRGLVRLAGVSNWTLERVQAANDYARQHGRRPIDAVSNNFSLARMIDPVWEGCEAASHETWRAWLTETSTPLFAWSSQARGYFAEEWPVGRLAEEIARCWDSPENRDRRARARDLAATRGVTTMNIALAYVLAQPFPTFALFGPRTIAETVTSLPALGISLTPEEIAWLDLRS